MNRPCGACGRVMFIHARGLCDRCYTRWRRYGDPLAPPQGWQRPIVPPEIVAEEWSALADPALSISENVRRLAPRLGMSVAGLERAVFRMRRQQRTA